MNRNWKIAGIVVACVLVILLAIPLFVNANSFRPRIEAEAASALGRPVTLGNLSFSLLTGSITVDDIKVADDPAFSSGPFITAKQLKVGVKLTPLIFSKRLEVTGIELKQPEIALLKGANGRWNFSSLGGNGGQKPGHADKSGDASDLSIGKLDISNGRITVGRANSSTKPQVYNKVDVHATNFAMTKQFPVEVSAGLPGGGSADIKGKAGPVNSQDAARTPFDLALKVKGLDLARSGFADPASGIAGNANLDGTLVSDGQMAKGAGTVTCDKFKFSPKGTPAGKPVTVKYALNSDLAKETGTITEGDIAVGKAAAQLTGGFKTQGDAEVVDLKLNAPNEPVDELEALLPAVGVVLPSGSRLTGGTLSADLAITGPVDKTVIAGPVRLSNSRLAGFDLGSKLSAIQAFTGKAAGSNDTAIQRASLNARVAGEGTRLDAIDVVVPALGTLTGAGVISPSGALDFKMKADLHGGVAGGLTQKVGLGGAGGAIPFSVQGTTSSPRFVPDVNGVATSVASQTLQNVMKGKTGGAANPLAGLLGKKP